MKGGDKPTLEKCREKRRERGIYKSSKRGRGRRESDLFIRRNMHKVWGRKKKQDRDKEKDENKEEREREERERERERERVGC